MNSSSFHPTSNHLKVGIIGTTNVGKSLLFNLLSSVEDLDDGVDYGIFSTIDNNLLISPFEDDRLEWLVNFYNPQIVSDLKYTVFDTVGIVPSCHKGFGFGMHSLNVLHSVDLIIHLIRGFDEDITHFQENIDPVFDLYMVDQELMKHDLQTIEQMIYNNELLLRRGEGGQRLPFESLVLKKAWCCLTGGERPEKEPQNDLERAKRKKLPPKMSPIPERCEGLELRSCEWEPLEKDFLASLPLFTTRDSLYLLNVSSIAYLRERARTQQTTLTLSSTPPPSPIPSLSQLQSYLSCKHPNSKPVFVLSLSFERERLRMLNEIAQDLREKREGDVRGSDKVNERGETIKGGKDEPFNQQQLTQQTLEEEQFENEDEAVLCGLREYKQSLLLAEEVFLAGNPTHLSALPSLLLSLRSSLSLMSFYTCNEEEVRVWSLKEGCTLSQAASLLDVQLGRELIRCDVLAFQDMKDYNGNFDELKLNGKIRSQGKKYCVCDGDIIMFNS